jgi:hypothetical protein
MTCCRFAGVRLSAKILENALITTDFVNGGRGVAVGGRDHHAQSFGRTGGEGVSAQTLVIVFHFHDPVP